jgi:hypothetical protein
MEKITTYKFKKNTEKNDHIIIYFTGMGRTVMFEWEGISNRLNLNADALFLVDNKDLFYKYGIENFSNNEDETIKKILEYGKYKRYDIIGSSMGGYASISHARKLSTKVNAEINILVFNAYINPNQSSLSYKFTENISLENYNDNYRGRKIFIVGKGIDDQKQLNYLNINNWIIKEYDTDLHTIGIYLKKNNLLDSIFNEFLNPKVECVPKLLVECLPKVSNKIKLFKKIIK